MYTVLRSTLEGGGEWRVLQTGLSYDDAVYSLADFRIEYGNIGIIVVHKDGDPDPVFRPMQFRIDG